MSHTSNLATVLAAPLLVSFVLSAAAAPVITFNQNFEGGSIGRIEKLDETVFRCHVEGQHDERGRNRQASWYFFRMDGVADRDVTLTLTDFVGEYNDKPGSCPMNADTVPVFSEDGLNWRHFPAMAWDDSKKEATLKFNTDRPSIWIAHIAPYTHSRLIRLLTEVGKTPYSRIEVIGKTVQNRDLHMVTVTNFEKPDEGKKTVWLQARQHAWETGTSYVMEGAIQFVTGSDPKAAALRDRVVFKFTPMMDPDGCARGKVRFNANGYDVNRHWNEVDLRSKEILARMPEIWYVKKALFAYVDSGRHIDLMLNLHNTETGEYMDTTADDEANQTMMKRFFSALVERTSFDPSKPLGLTTGPSNTTNSLYREKKIPVLLMEQRTATGKKFGRRPTDADRLEFGKALITVMAETVLSNP